MEREWLRWGAAMVFAGLAILQAYKWGVMGLAVQGPLLLILVLGLIVAGFKDSLPFRNHFLFSCAYSAAFLLLWGVGHPRVQLVIGKTWGFSLLALLVLGIALVLNLRDRKGFWWLVALSIATGFGLFIAFASGPQGSTPWLFRFYMDLFNFREDEWQKGLDCVFYTRKSLHFLGYGIASLSTAYLVFKSSNNFKKGLLFGFFWPLPIALFDEWQQSLSPEVRTGKVADVILDVSGMLFFLLIFWISTRRKPELVNEQ